MFVWKCERCDIDVSDEWPHCAIAFFRHYRSCHLGADRPGWSNPVSVADPHRIEADIAMVDSDCIALIQVKAQDAYQNVIDAARFGAAVLALLDLEPEKGGNVHFTKNPDGYRLFSSWIEASEASRRPEFIAHTGFDLTMDAVYSDQPVKRNIEIG